MITFEDIKNNADIRTYIQCADESLAALGFTEHSFAHVGRCADVAARILNELGYPAREVELARIAAFMHDIGNVVNRHDHAISGATMAFRILDKMGMEPAEVATVIPAIGHRFSRKRGGCRPDPGGQDRCAPQPGAQQRCH